MKSPPCSDAGLRGGPPRRAAPLLAALAAAALLHLLALAALPPQASSVARPAADGPLQVRLLAHPVTAPAPDRQPTRADPIAAAAATSATPHPVPEQPHTAAAVPAAAASSAGTPAADGSAATYASQVQTQPARSGYWPREALDRPALPYSEPDWQGLDIRIASGRPVHLRLYIGAQGRVDDVIALAADDQDADWIEQLRQALLATRYVPGRRGGVDVATFTDLRIDFDPQTQPE